jgi:hypothetical protein
MTKKPRDIGASVRARLLNLSRERTQPFDLHLLGFGESSADSIVAAFRDICRIEQNDGVTFDAAALRVTVIREELKYGDGCAS